MIADQRYGTKDCNCTLKLWFFLWSVKYCIRATRNRIQEKVESGETRLSVHVKCLLYAYWRLIFLWCKIQIACKSSDLDPMPTSLVKDCIDILITLITSIIKSAQVSLLLKKPSLEKESTKNYCPLFNLSFLFKVLEKVVVNQLNSHINNSNISNQHQSAYRKFHSTETALLKIHNDILASLDAGKVTALTLLDIAAAFDTIDHTFLLRRLDDWFGVPGKAFDWSKSYLTGRCQRIRLRDCFSFKADLKFGVPQ